MNECYSVSQWVSVDHQVGMLTNRVNTIVDEWLNQSIFRLA